MDRKPIPIVFLTEVKPTLIDFQKELKNRPPEPIPPIAKEKPIDMETKGFRRVSATQLYDEKMAGMITDSGRKILAESMAKFGGIFDVNDLVALDTDGVHHGH
jgi:hypothetical protein